MPEGGKNIFGGGSFTGAAKRFLGSVKSRMPSEIIKRKQLAAKAKRESEQDEANRLRERVRKLEADNAASAAAAKKKAATRVVVRAAKKSAATAKKASKAAAKTGRKTTAAIAKSMSSSAKAATKASAKKAKKFANAAKKTVAQLAKQHKKQSGFNYKPAPFGSGIGLMGPPSSTKVPVHGIPRPSAKPPRKSAGKITKPIK